MKESSWHSYPSPKALGHAMCRDVLEGDVWIQEKIDGSQFSFGSFDDELRIRSRGRVMDLDAPVDNLFEAGVKTVRALFERRFLKDGWMYSGEYLKKPKHNTLTYDKIPPGHIALFDVRVGMEQYLDPRAVIIESERLGLGYVDLLWHGPGSDVDKTLIDGLMDHPSSLGGDFKIEGIVIKNYNRFSADGKAQMAKVVSEKFKEKHKGEWKKTAPGGKDILDTLRATYRTEARWRKAVQHLMEEGAIGGEPRDIGPLIKEIVRDLRIDSGDEIKTILYRWAMPQIERAAVAGFPQWYKNELMNQQFETE